jgi:transposase
MDEFFWSGYQTLRAYGYGCGGHCKPLSMGSFSLHSTTYHARGQAFRRRKASDSPGPRVLHQRKKKQHDPLKRDVRERTAECVGLHLTTVKTVIYAKATQLAPPGEAPPASHPAAPRPRPTAVVEKYGDDIRSIVRGRNLRGQLVTSRLIKADLQSLTGVILNDRSLRKALKKLGFRYKKGAKRHFLAESAGVAILRQIYLKMKRANRLPNGLPRLPEIFLDESYVNMNHTNDYGWQEKGSVRHSRSGRGNRVVVIGAGVVWNNKGKLCAGWVDGSFVVWRADLKSKRKADGSQVEDDYHGNFTAPKFERWFRALCDKLTETFGRCRIHLDGASYHKRCVNRAPTGSDRKDDIQKWLEDNEIFYEEKWTKAELLQLVAANKESPKYAIVEIARGEHDILFTPPYHPCNKMTCYARTLWQCMRKRVHGDLCT